MSIPKHAAFSILGDSISTLDGFIPQDWRCHYQREVHIPGIIEPADTWWGQVIEHFEGHLLSNASFSGSVVQGYGFPAATSPKRIEALLGPDGQQPDVVLFFMGVNDYGWGGGRNQVMGRSLSATARPEDIPGSKEVLTTVGAPDLELFEKAYAQVLAGIHSIAPQADIWCVTLCPGTVPGETWPNFCWSVRGLELDDYNQAIRRAALAAGAHVADIRAFERDYDAVDSTHPTALGMRQLAQMVISQMEGQVLAAADTASDPQVDQLLASARQSTRACFEQSCAGCTFANITPHNWSLHCSKFAPLGATKK